MHKLSVEAPPKILVERYLIEIAKNYNVPYEPDAMVRVSVKESAITPYEGWSHVLRLFTHSPTLVSGQPEVCPGEEADLIDVNNDKKSGGGGGGGGFHAGAMPMPMHMPMPMPTAFNYPPPNGAVRYPFSKAPIIYHFLWVMYLLIENRPPLQTWR